MSISGINGYGVAAQAALRAQKRQDLPEATGSLFSMDDTSATDSSSSGMLSTAPVQGADPVSEFMNYMKETTAQKMQDTWLSQHHITRQQFDAMGADEKQKIIDQMKKDIEDKIKQSMNGQQGSDKDHAPVDVMA